MGSIIALSWNNLVTVREDTLNSLPASLVLQCANEDLLSIVEPSTFTQAVRAIIQICACTHLITCKSGACVEFKSSISYNYGKLEGLVVRSSHKQSLSSSTEPVS